MTSKKISIYFFLLCLMPFGQANAQNMKAYEGHWESELAQPQAFSPKLSIQLLNARTALLKLSGLHGSIQQRFSYVKGKTFQVKLGEGLVFRGSWNQKEKTITGFIKSGQWFYHLQLLPDAKMEFTTNWNILLASNFNSRLYLSIENADGENFEAYAFSSEVRYPGFFCYDFKKSGDHISFRDFRTGLALNGKLEDKRIPLQIKIGKLLLATLALKPSAKDWDLKSGSKPTRYSNERPQQLNDGLSTLSLQETGLKIDESYLQKMVDSINANKITNTHSVLIAKNNKLLYEAYFGGNDAATPHDLRSASKSISSALIGMAIDRHILRDTAQKLVDLLPSSYQSLMQEPRKQAISLGNLLTMSSGIDAVDFGIERKSAAAEDNYQPTPDWAKTVLAAPMINYPGTHANYGSANPYLLGFVLAHKLKQGTLDFIDQNLYKPLAISNYIIQQDEKANPYFGGGIFMRSRDMLKFGLLYANKGQWQGRQLISRAWVNASFKNYLNLENHPEKNGYGFLWWHYSYKVGNRMLESIEARGAGGQYIFILPALDMVIVITSGNFRNGRVWQPEKIVENYILPAFINN
ncbi:serine hydrolase [Pedobacter sp. KR3-3]|uniref:Serine hydrolase n=1 Tax=Pedobacter albus TaxID=3113905 RepID=A0ABU7I345_9SPHI|nr:serine hydrolase [Pedobacter sp. KR3-3]MEE1943791.1 serine hydrolase [Pedobacter sp. KR3-3]